MLLNALFLLRIKVSLLCIEHDVFCFFVDSGSFKVNPESLGVKAYLASKACQKVVEFSEYSLPQEVEVKKVPRLEVWPERWKSSGPTEDCIGLLFFAPSLRSNEVSDELVKELIESDSAFQASIGIVDLLIFPSTQLPEHNHFYHGKHYLWGVFYKRRNDTCEEGVTVGGQEGSVRAIEEEELQEQHVLDQQVEVQHESPVQEEGFTSPPEPSASSVAGPSAEEGGREQPSSDSEPATIKPVGVASTRTPRAHQQQTQEKPSEGSMVFSVPEEMVTADVIVGGQHGSVCAMEEEQLQEQYVLDQQDEVQLESPGQEEGFNSPSEPNASSVADPSAEEGGREQSSSVSEPTAIKLVGVASARTPRDHQQQTQEKPSEGSMVFSVPEDMVTADVIVGGQYGSVCAMEEEQLQEQHVLDQQDEVQLESPGQQASAVKLSGNQPMVENVPEVEEGFISPSEPNASSLAEHSAEEGGQGQSGSVSEPLTIELFGVTVFSTPRGHQQQTQEMPSEGSMVFPVPEDMVTADSNIDAVGAGQNLPDETLGLNGPGGNAGLELSLVQHEQVGLAAPGVELEDSSMEVDLELRLAVTPSPVQQEQQAAPGVEASNMEVDLELSLAVKPSCDLQLKMLG
ncbi:unnamed protein product [Urochloa humidicola]